MGVDGRITLRPRAHKVVVEHAYVARFSGLGHGGRILFNLHRRKGPSGACFLRPTVDHFLIKCLHGKSLLKMSCKPIIRDEAADDHLKIPIHISYLKELNSGILDRDEDL